MKKVICTLGIGCIVSAITFIVGDCYGYITACNELDYDVTIGTDFTMNPRKRNEDNCFECRYCINSGR